MSSYESIIQGWNKKQYKNCYLFHGEESFYIDLLMHHAEHEILNEIERSFNLTILYGKDSDWTTIVNACRRYPMNAERQVILIKEAQLLQSIEKLEVYLEKPMSSTILVIGYKGKKFDKRIKIFKLIEKMGVVFESNPIPDYQMFGWVEQQLKKMGFEASGKSIDLLVNHIGNDLSRMVHEIEKLSINLKGTKIITEKDIELYIGISREYNVFELQQAIADRNLGTALKIIQFFAENPKENPIHKILPALYAFYGKVHAAFGAGVITEAALKPVFYNNPFATKQAMSAMKKHGLHGIEKIILLMQHYNLKSLGMDDAGTKDADLVKEMVSRMILD